MMAYFSIAAALLLFGVLGLHILRSKYETALPDTRIGDCSAAGTCDVRFGDDIHVAQQVMSRVFSTEDAEFVASLESSELERLVVQERKKLALQWVARKSREARRIVREHAQASRTAQDLQVLGELQLLAHYLELRALCGLLVILVMALGPAGMHRLAAEADTLFLRIRSGTVGTAGVTAS
jgi:hypothetical protein